MRNFWDTMIFTFNKGLNKESIVALNIKLKFIS